MKKEYRNAIRTQKMIQDAFIELLDERKRLESITVSELCARADIAKSTFYNHYTDIYQVVEEFEDRLIAQLCYVLDQIEADRATEYDIYIKEVIAFLQENEDFYRSALASPDARFVVEKMKTIISKKIFEESTVLPFSGNGTERYVQIRILTNACVDTVADYFKGLLDVSLEEVGDILIAFIKRLCR